MNDLSWSAALTLLCVVSSIALIAIGTHKRSKKRNRRLGLPAPECQRVPAWDSDKYALTRREVS
jgi:hypothetical protein